MAGSGMDTRLSPEPARPGSWAFYGTTMKSVSLFGDGRRHESETSGDSGIAGGCWGGTPFQREVEPKDKGSPSLGDTSSAGQTRLCLHVPMNSLFCLKQFELRFLSFTAERRLMDVSVTTVIILARKQNEGRRTGHLQVTRTSLGKITDGKRNNDFPPQFRKNTD